MNLRRASIAFVALTLTLACSAACSLLVPFDGFVGVDAGDAATADARADDATTIDGSSSDGATDGSAAADTGSVDAAALDGTTFCGALDATFCSDFDDPTLTLSPFGWTAPAIRPAGQNTVRLDDTTFFSKPEAIAFDISAGFAPFSGGRVALLQWIAPHPTAPMSVRLIYHVRIDAVDPSEEFIATSLNFGNGPQSYAVDINLGNGKAAIEEEVYDVDGGAYAYPTTPVSIGANNPGGWMFVDLTVDFNAMTLTLKFNATVVASNQPLATGALTGGPVTLFLGPEYYTNTSVAATHVHFDNVALTAF